MSNEEERIDVDFPDDVLVRRGLDDGGPGLRTRDRARRFGAWYVRLDDGPETIGLHVDTRFCVGRDSCGRRLAWGLTYWEARRVALAMDDATLTIPSCDLDLCFVVEAIIASALMDHYVFPICNYLR